jgi:outer membrane receptor protein involved in Fe transport
MPFPPFEIEQTTLESFRTEQLSAYAYGNYAITQNLTAIIGGSLDVLEGRLIDKRRFNPKLGLVWDAGSRTSIRATVAQTLQGPLVSKEDTRPRLEPTQIAGFNQIYFGSEGDRATRLGLAVDHTWSDKLYFGTEWSKRNIDRSFVVAAVPAEFAGSEIDIEESSLRSYVYWMLNDFWALSASLSSETVDNGGLVLADGFAELRTQRVPVGLRYFHPSGFRAGIEATRVNQSGIFGELRAGPGGFETVVHADSERFWVADAFVSYKLPGRHGIIGISVHNLTNQSFRFQDTDPENPSIIPEQFVSLRFTLAL